MTLKELQKMIKEEMNSYTNEAAYGPSRADMDAAEERSANVKAGKWSDGRVQNKSMQREVDVSVDDGDIDADGDVEGNTDEDVLRQIYDMLKDKFEGEEAGDDMDDMDDMDDVEGEEDEDSDLDENATTDSKYQKTGMAPASKGSAGPNVGMKPPTGKGSTGYDAGSQALQERFQKLANIIK
jgi:hypothetical protein